MSILSWRITADGGQSAKDDVKNLLSVGGPKETLPSWEDAKPVKQHPRHSGQGWGCWPPHIPLEQGITKRIKATERSCGTAEKSHDSATPPLPSPPALA